MTLACHGHVLEPSRTSSDQLEKNVVARYNPEKPLCFCGSCVLKDHPLVHTDTSITIVVLASAAASRGAFAS